MAVTSRFFNSTIQSDSGYAASDFAKLHDMMYSTGVFFLESPDVLRVESAGHEMRIRVLDGSATVNGYIGTVHGGGEILTLDYPGSQSRTDLVVMRLDFTRDATGHERAGSIYPDVVKGIPGGEMPPLTRTADIWELCLARIDIPAGAIDLTQAVITDTRWEGDLCGEALIRGSSQLYVEAPDEPKGQPAGALWMDTRSMAMKIKTLSGGYEKYDDKADKDHRHTKEQISNFPDSMPASDVSDWAKAKNKPTYTAADVGAAVTDTYSATISPTWSGNAAPYTQSITVSGLLDSDTPDITPDYSSDNVTAIAQREAWGLIGKAVTGANSITFVCFEEKPVTAIPIQIRVVR